MAIGISYELFWHLNPRKLKPFFEAFKIKRKMRDEEMWCMGKYIMSALDSTVCNNFLWRGKNGKASKYVEKPFMHDNEETEQSQNKDEMAKRAEQLFAQLSIMEVNFKLNKKDGKAK